MKPREKIDLSDSQMDIIMKMSEGNPGAATVIGQMLKADPMALLELLHLDDMGIRGSQIWVAYKDHCGGDLAKFRKLVKERDKEMVSTVNRVCGRQGHPLAVGGGASFA